jgi:hypothetical protein
MPADPLESILAQAGLDTEKLHRDGLEILGRTITRQEPDEFIDAITRTNALAWDNGEWRPAEYFEIHSRSWWLDLSNHESRQHLLTTILAAVLLDALNLTGSIAWVAQVVPDTIGIDAVNMSDERLHLALSCYADFGLPPHLRDIVNPIDHAEFVETVSNATGIEHNFAGGTIFLRRR